MCNDELHTLLIAGCLLLGSSKIAQKIRDIIGKPFRASLLCDASGAFLSWQAVKHTSSIGICKRINIFILMSAV